MAAPALPLPGRALDYPTSFALIVPLAPRRAGFCRALIHGYMSRAIGQQFSQS